MSIEQWEPRAELALSTQQDAAVQRLGDWAQSADAAYRVAERLSQSSFVPAQFRGKAVELSAAILSGLEVGLSPMAAMRAFDIIQGQAAPRAITLRAIVQSHGHEMVLIESTASRCRMKGKRRGSDEWQTVSWTMERAQALGLASKDGWKKQPAAMLIARATSELARLIASDAILGIGYSSEEIADGGTYEQQVATDMTEPSAPAGTRKMSRRPSKPPEQVPDETAETGEEMTQRTRGHMFALFAEHNIAERDEQIRGIVHIIGRPIESRSEITEAEGLAVIAKLEARPRPEVTSEDAFPAEPGSPA